MSNHFYTTVDQPLSNNIPDENSIDPCLVGLQMQLEKANKQIEQLKRERDELLKQVCDIEADLMGYAIAGKGSALADKYLNKLKLEQQAKGLEDFKASYTSHELYPSKALGGLLDKCINHLRQQAEG